MKNNFKFIPLLLILGIIVMAIGFSASNVNMVVSDIGLVVRPQVDIRVTGLTTTLNGDASFSDDDYNVDYITSKVSLNEYGATATFEVEVTNYGNEEMGIYDITGLPEDLKIISVNGYNLQEKIYDSDKDKYTLNASQSFSITVGYESLEKYNNSVNHQYIVNLNFDFRSFHDVYYNNNIINYVIHGGDKIINLGSSTISGVNVSGSYTDKSYSAPNLTLEGVTSDIYVTPATLYVYDPDNLEEGTHTYTDSPGQPTVTVVNGKVTSFEFSATGDTVLSGEGIDTGFIPFEDGKSFEIELEVAFPQTPNKANSSVLLDIYDRLSPQTNKILRIAYANNSNNPLLYTNGTSGKSVALRQGKLNLVITYNYSTKKLSIKNYNSRVYNASFELSLSNVRLLLGYTTDENGNPIRQADITVTRFYVHEV